MRWEGITLVLGSLSLGEGGKGGRDRVGQHKRHTACQDVLKAHVKGAVGVRGEGVAVLACYVARLAVLVAHGVFDVHVEHHAVAAGAGDGGGHDD